jgi:hypothetical protein
MTFSRTEDGYAMADNSLDQLVAEITYHYKLGQMLNDAAGEKEVRAARWRHLLVATQLLRELRSRVEATGGDYTAQIDRLIRAAKEFDRSAIFNSKWQVRRSRITSRRRSPIHQASRGT